MFEQHIPQPLPHSSQFRSNTELPDSESTVKIWLLSSNKHAPTTPHFEATYKKVNSSLWTVNILVRCYRKKWNN